MKQLRVWEPVRRGWKRDLHRVAPKQEEECGAVSREGWTCSLFPRHRGKHEAWCTEPFELACVWRA